MLKIFDKKGIASIIEIIITAIVFSIAAVSIFAVTSMLRPQGVQSSRKLEAAYIGRQFIEQFRKQVDASIWNIADTDENVTNLYPGHPYSETETGADGTEYTINWMVIELPSGVRELSMNVYYPDL